MTTKKIGMMFVLSSPSGAGKTTLTKKIAEQNTNFSISISHTTRKPRPSEVNGKDYYFVSKEEFKKLTNKNNFFEYANIFDNCYGTSKKPIIDLLAKGENVLFDIDWQGTKQLKKNKELLIVTFFIIPPDLKVLEQRLLDRHNGQKILVEERMKKFHEELSHWKEYDYVFVNDNLEVCYNDILKVISSVKKGEKINQNTRIIKSKIDQLSK